MPGQNSSVKTYHETMLSDFFSLDTREIALQQVLTMPADTLMPDEVSIRPIDFECKLVT